MARVALLKTDTLNTANFTVALPLGILSLAAVAREAGHQVRALDLATIRLSELRAALQSVVDFKPHVVGFSAMSPQFPVLDEVSRYLRRALPDSLFAVGGALVSSELGDALQALPQVDVAAVGEAEHTFPRLLEWRTEGGSLQRVEGILYRRGDDIVATDPAPAIEDLDSLPMPAFDQIDLHRYARFLTPTMRRYLHHGIFTSRGCPFRCGYCHGIFGKRFRARSVANVMAEIRTMHDRWGFGILEFYDDIFNFDMDRATEILERIHLEFPDLRIAFWNGLRLDLIDEPFVKLLGKVAWMVALPVETASDRLRQEVGRTARMSKVRRVVRWTRKYGIYTFGYFMVGFPGETREEMDLTFDAARHLDIDLPIIIQFVPFKNTPLAQRIVEEGGELPPPWTANYSRSDLNFSEVPTEYIHEQRANLFRKVFLARPQNWYQLRHLARWMAWWLRPGDLAWYGANSLRSNFAWGGRAKAAAAGRLFERRERDVFGRMARELRG